MKTKKQPNSNLLAPMIFIIKIARLHENNTCLILYEYGNIF